MKNKTTQGLRNKNVLSFPKHDLLKYWRLRSNVNSHMSYVNTICNSYQSILSLSDLSGGKWCLQRKCMCRLHEALDCRKLHKQLSNSCQTSDKGHVWQLHEWYPFVTFLARGGYLFFIAKKICFKNKFPNSFFTHERSIYDEVLLKITYSERPLVLVP
jgi:hypothetical protein